MDEGLNNGLAELCGVEVERTLQCRKEVVQFINLDNLVLTNVEAQAIMAGEQTLVRPLSYLEQAF